MATDGEPRSHPPPPREPSGWQHQLRALVEPGPHVEGALERRRVRFVLSVILVMIVVAALAIAASLILPPDLQEQETDAGALLLMGAATVVFLGAYGLARGRYHAEGAFLMVLTTWLAVVAAILLGVTPDPMGAIVFLALPLFLSSVLLPATATLLLSGLSVAALILLPRRVPAMHVSVTLIAVVVIFTLLAMAIHRIRARDMDQIHDQARRLAASEQRIRRLLDATFEAVVIHDRGRIVDANERFAELFGWPPDEIEGTWLGRFLDLDELRVELEHGDGRDAIEAVGRPRAGQPFPIEVRTRPLAEGERRLNVLVIRDLTERKAIELERARRSEEAARRAELEQLVWLTSHALRSPVRTISSFSQLLEQRYGQDLPEEAAAFLGFVEDGALELDHLMQDLRRFAETITREAPHRPVNLDPMVREVVADALDKAPGQKVARTIDRLPTVRGDKVQLDKLFEELVDNAVIHNANGQGSLAIRAEQEGHWWHLTITDDGPGIPTDHHERVFELFQRLGAEDGSPGTGMGLALARRIVEQHGGKIWIESPVTGRDGPAGGTRGTRVHLTLPSPSQGPREVLFPQERLDPTRV